VVDCWVHLLTIPVILVNCSRHCETGSPSCSYLERGTRVVVSLGRIYIFHTYGLFSESAKFGASHIFSNVYVYITALSM